MCLFVARYLACGGAGRGGLLGLDLLPVVFDEILLLAVAKTGVELVLLHLSHNLLEIPIIFIEAIDRPHDSGAMTTSRAVYVELACLRIVDNLQKLIHLLHAGIALINHGNVDVTQSRSLDSRLLILP